MAINLNSGDSSACSSPRYSFSNDLPQNNPNQAQEQVHPNRLDMSLLSSSLPSSLDPNFDFDFCVDAGFPESESFPADDLFYNGVIIPTQMKQKLNSMQQEEVTSVTTATIIREEKSSLKSFWRFRRSSSLNCGHKKSSLSWSMPLLFRSKSTGSSSLNDNPKRSHKNSSSNNGKSMMNNTSTTTATATSTTNIINNQSARHSTSSCQKPPLKKSGSGGVGSYVNGVRVSSSAMNVPPPPYITKGTSDLLGFSSLFRNGNREKKSKI